MISNNKIKKIIIVLFALLLLPLSACNKPEPKEITCEEIIKVYEYSGYIVEHHLHKEEMTDSDVICSICIKDSKNSKDNVLYIDRYKDEETASSYAKDMKYNVIVWFMSSIYGESRWLKSEQYGVIHYHTYDSKMTKPLESLME